MRGLDVDTATTTRKEPHSIRPHDHLANPQQQHHQRGPIRVVKTGGQPDEQTPCRRPMHTITTGYLNDRPPPRARTPPHRDPCERAQPMSGSRPSAAAWRRRASRSACVGQGGRIRLAYSMLVSVPAARGGVRARNSRPATPPPPIPRQPVSTEQLAPDPVIAVGTAVAGGPPRRSQRALLTHWAPALGAGVKSLLWIGVHDLGRRQPSRRDAVHPRPVQARALAATP